MTRRIALSILATVWALLLIGGVTVYLIVRAALVDQLDHSLVKLVLASAPELAPPAPQSAPPATQPAPARIDRAAGRPQPVAGRPDTIEYYVIQGATGHVSPPAGGRPQVRTELLTGAFSRLPDGHLVRNVTFRATFPPSADAAAASRGPYTVLFRGSAQRLDQLLDRLLLAFIAFGAAAGAATAFVAVRVSRAALRPLHATADVIGTIDPSNLHRRIDAARLPPELLPMADRLNEMLGRIEEAYARRQQFLADASHELRTPVAALVTTAEVSLRHPRPADAYRATLETCLSDARMLRRLVERLMEQCRADTLSHDEPADQSDLAPLLHQCVDQAAVLAGERQVTVDREIPPRLVVTVQIGRLRSVVANLLSNAVEYNRPGGTVALRAARAGETLQITVRDTGLGIADEHLPHLFEPFYRADRARSGEAAHLGLGLSLVQSHVAAMAGRVRVESTAGEGTTFVVELPINKPPAGAL
jgi:signal transduction histidine kinase